MTVRTAVLTRPRHVLQPRRYIVTVVRVTSALTSSRNGTPLLRSENRAEACSLPTRSEFETPGFDMDAATVEDALHRGLGELIDLETAVADG